MRSIIIDEPQVDRDSVAFSWRVEPACDLYRHQRFNLRFHGQLDPRQVPEDLWWVVALVCLHPHWALLRPCTVELPVELAPGEREFWLRLSDAGVRTLERTWGRGDVARTVEIRDRGRRLPPAPKPGDERVALAFSGGKDSLAHVGLLLELGERPVAVTSTSPMWPLVDHAAPRRRTAIETIADDDRVDHVEVRSDYRDCWNNSFAQTRGYEIAVSELSDTMLYLAATLVVGWDRGASRVLLASEAELQTTVVRDGDVVQNPHFMYSAVTQQALSRLLERRGMSHGSLTYPLRAWQVRELLWSRYPRLRKLQYSCWRHDRGESACSGCSDCLANAVTALRHGVGPSRLGIDVRTLMERMGGWEPALAGGELPDEQAKRELHGAVVRNLAAMRTRHFTARLARTDPRQIARRRGIHTLARYGWLRGRVAPAAESVPPLGYRHAFLELVDERWRDRLERLLDAEFEREHGGADAVDVARTRSLIDHISAPLSEGR